MELPKSLYIQDHPHALQAQLSSHWKIKWSLSRSYIPPGTPPRHYCRPLSPSTAPSLALPTPWKYLIADARTLSNQTPIYHFISLFNMRLVLRLFLWTELAKLMNWQVFHIRLDARQLFQQTLSWLVPEKTKQFLAFGKPDCSLQERNHKADYWWTTLSLQISSRKPHISACWVFHVLLEFGWNK